MRIELIILASADAPPRREEFERDVITIGRDPTSDLRFDMAADLEVSTRHAEIREQDGACVIVDKASTNGTWVNGSRLKGVQELHAGDVVNLGRRGPEFRIALINDEVWHETVEVRGLPPVPKDPTPKRNRTQEWIEGRLAMQSRSLNLIVSAVVVGVAVLGVAGWLHVRAIAVDDPQVWREVTMPAIRKANDDAVALIEVAFPSPVCRSGCEGTGFSIAPNGLIVTNRHVVVQGGATATSIRVKFANSAKWTRARLVRVATDPTIDIALIQVTEAGYYPAVVGVGSTGPDLPIGSDVMAIGFPRGTRLLMDGSGPQAVARTTTTAGAIAKILRELFQVDAFADHGSSGSPVFDRHGHVIGVVSSGAADVSAKVVYVVPSNHIVDLLRSAGLVP